MKSRLVLLDANIVIQLFTLKLWDAIVAHYDVVLAETVVDEADFYFDDDNAIKIDITTDIDAGRVSIESLSASDVARFCRRFGPMFQEKLDPGEAESLALLDASDQPVQICSADAIVYRVLGSLNRGEQGVSLEELLRHVGRTTHLPRQYTKAAREQWTKQGAVEGLMGFGPKA